MITAMTWERFGKGEEWGLRDLIYIGTAIDCLFEMFHFGMGNVRPASMEIIKVRGGDRLPTEAVMDPLCFERRDMWQAWTLDE